MKNAHYEQLRKENEQLKKYIVKDAEIKESIEKPKEIKSPKEDKNSEKDRFLSQLVRQK